MSKKEQKAIVELADSLYELEGISLVDAYCDAITEFFVTRITDEGVIIDEIVFLNGGEIESCGYRIEITFLKDSLHDIYDHYDEQIMENPERDINIRDSIIKTLNAYAKGLGKDIDFSGIDIGRILREPMKRIKHAHDEVKVKTDSLLKLRFCKKML